MQYSTVLFLHTLMLFLKGRSEICEIVEWISLLKQSRFKKIFRSFRHWPWMKKTTDENEFFVADKIDNYRCFITGDQQLPARDENSAVWSPETACSGEDRKSSKYPRQFLIILGQFPRRITARLFVHYVIFNVRFTGSTWSTDGFTSPKTSADHRPIWTITVSFPATKLFSK